MTQVPACPDNLLGKLTNHFLLKDDLDVMKRRQRTIGVTRAGGAAARPFTYGSAGALTEADNTLFEVKPVPKRRLRMDGDDVRLRQM